MQLELLKGGFAVEQGTSKPIQLPAQNHVDPASGGICHQSVKLWATGLGATPAGIDVLTANLPAVAPGVGTDFGKLKVAILIGGADTGVNGSPDLVCWIQFRFTPLRRSLEVNWWKLLNLMGLNPTP